MQLQGRRRDGGDITESESLSASIMPHPKLLHYRAEVEGFRLGLWITLVTYWILAHKSLYVSDRVIFLLVY